MPHGESTHGVISVRERERGLAGGMTQYYYRFRVFREERERRRGGKQFYWALTVLQLAPNALGGREGAE